jgi:hypothetical protein
MKFYKTTLLAIGLFAQQFAFSQTTAIPTNQFVVKGLVDSVLTIKYSDLAKEKLVTIGDFTVTNHLGEFKKTYKGVKGIMLLDVLKPLVITSASPKLLSEYYLVFKASDGYTVVASWNELFNTEVGKTFYLVTEADGKSLDGATESILLINTKDFKTGRRHVKGLQSIEVKRI